MFSGLFTYVNAPPPSKWLNGKNWQNSLHPFHTPDRVGTWQNDLALCCECVSFNTPSSHYAISAPFVNDDCVVAFWGRLDNRKELSCSLSLTKPLAQATDAELCQLLWKQCGEELPERLKGNFAIAVIDVKNKTLFLARDPLGTKPIYYWPHDKGFLYASTPAVFRHLKGFQPTPDIDWVARHVVRLTASHTETAYKEVKKLPGGHCAIITHHGEVKVRRYHHWHDDAPQVFVRREEHLEAYRNVLEDTIKRHLPSNYKIGLENSGGLDSATTTAFAAKFSQHEIDKLQCFGFAFHRDEPSHILATSRAWNIKRNHLVTGTIGPEEYSSDTVMRDLKVLGYPEENVNGSIHRPFYEECHNQNIRTLISGYGGDEVVTNYASHVRHELFDKGQYWPFFQNMPGNYAQKAARVLKYMFVGRNPVEYNPMLLTGITRKLKNLPLRAEIVDRFNINERHLKIAEYDAPYRRHNDLIINGLMTIGGVPTRFESCTLLAASYGVEYRWPLWDATLVQSYLSTPIIERYGPDGVNRYLHRRAIAGAVPDLVAWRDYKEMGPPIPCSVGSAENQITLDLLKRNANNLHPMLDEVIDRDKWQQEIRRLESEIGDNAPKSRFRFSAKAVNMLNHWLHDGPVA